MAVEEIVWTNSALQDLQNIHDFISQDQPAHANALIDNLVDSTEELQDFPRLGRLFRFRQVRLRQLSVRGYRIIYRLAETQIRIVSVLHGARDINLALQSRKLH